LSAKVTCEQCFFKQRGLCALLDGAPCPSFRPDTPQGLRPPRQLRFEFRQERMLQCAWAFPDAEAQAVLHA
jgi:hypothetical protein